MTQIVDRQQMYLCFVFIVITVIQQRLPIMVRTARMHVVRPVKGHYYFRQPIDLILPNIESCCYSHSNHQQLEFCIGVNRQLRISYMHHPNKWSYLFSMGTLQGGDNSSNTYTN